MADQQLIDEVQQFIQKANRSLAAAQQLHKTGDYDFASSRAYYAVFYGMQATLLTKSLSPATHEGIMRLFNQHFIKPIIFPKEFGRYLSQLFRARQIGDYSLGIAIENLQSQHNIQTAETILQSITDYLIREGFLPSK